MLPSTATVIKITNILTPYIVRIYEVKDYNEKLNSINKKLLKEEKTFHSTEKDVEPKIGYVRPICNIYINFIMPILVIINLILYKISYIILFIIILGSYSI